MTEKSPYTVQKVFCPSLLGTKKVIFIDVSNAELAEIIELFPDEVKMDSNLIEKIKNSHYEKYHGNILQNVMSEYMKDLR